MTLCLLSGQSQHKCLVHKAVLANSGQIKQTQKGKTSSGVETTCHSLSETAHRTGGNASYLGGSFQNDLLVQQLSNHLHMPFLGGQM